MQIKVKYFAMLREALDCDEETVTIPETVKTVGELKAWLTDKDDTHRTAFTSVKRIRAAVNGVMAQDAAALKDGDETAYFPPVTGG